MTAAPHSPLVVAVGDAIRETMKNGKLQPETAAQAALDTCHFVEMRDLLMRLEQCHLGDRAFDEAAVYEVYRDAQALLAKMDGGS